MTHLKLLRLENHLKQEELANKIGVKRWKISLAERGSILALDTVLNKDDVSRLEKFFDTSIEQLVSSISLKLKGRPR